MTGEPTRSKGGEPSTHRVDVPTAAMRPDRRISIAWVLPAIALILAGWVVYAAWAKRGVTIIVDFKQGHGLKAGDAVRCRGIAIGQVRKVELMHDLDGVRVTVNLHAQAQHVARAGTQFYIARPRLRLTEVEGLETLIGPRYLAAMPPTNGTDRRRQRVFIGLADAPAVESIDVDDLEVTVHTERRGSLRAGGAVLYRQVRIGTILSVGLTSASGIPAASRPP
jgi:paraquat-inducible protein B